MYLKEINYELVVVVKRNGSCYPMILIQDSGIPKILEMLGADEMQNLSFVEQTIMELEKIDIKSDKESYLYRKSYYLKIVGSRVNVFPESYVEDYIEMDYIILVDLINDWKSFLSDFYSGKIKAIVPNQPA